jgi:hypothetical protein
LDVSHKVSLASLFGYGCLGYILLWVRNEFIDLVIILLDDLE